MAVRVVVRLRPLPPDASSAPSSAGRGGGGVDGAAAAGGTAGAAGAGGASARLAEGRRGRGGVDPRKPWVRVRGDSVTVNRPASSAEPHRFTFDQVFPGEARHPDTDAPMQDAVYTAVARPLLKRALAGFNATIFAYGQTGCVCGGAAGRVFCVVVWRCISHARVHGVACVCLPCHTTGLAKVSR